MSLNPPLPTGPSPGTPPVAEREIVSNRFGTVTNLAVHYNVKKGLLAGAKREDLIMRHVVASRSETVRHPIWGALLALIGVSWLLGAQNATSILALILLLSGAFLLWGWPKVSVTAADGAARPSVSWPWTQSEAKDFVNGVSQELLRRG